MNPNGPFLPGVTGLAMTPAAKPSGTVYMTLMRAPGERRLLGGQPRCLARVAAQDAAISQMADVFG
jgi:hypothetical protein